MIKSLKDLADVIGANRPDLKSIEHRLYKDTSCGAWINSFKPGHIKGAEKEKTIKAHGRKGLGGIYWTLFTMNGRKITDDAIIKRVVEYARAFKSPNGFRSTNKILSVIDKALTEPSDRFTVRKIGKVKRIVTFKLSVAPLKKHKGGVKIGSIVEGVDHGTGTHELFFPFTEKTWWEAVKEVEDEAKDIWDETHGCQDCYPEEDTTETNPINPECKSCKGQGTII